MDYTILRFEMAPRRSFPIHIEEAGIFHLRVVYTFQVQIFLLVLIKSKISNLVGYYYFESNS